MFPNQGQGPSGVAMVPMGALMGQSMPEGEPIEPPQFDDYGVECPKCGADPNPWEGDDVIAANVDLTVLDTGVALIVEAACTCGWEDRAVIQ